MGQVGVGARGDTSVVTVRYENKARGLLPIRVRFTFSDKTTQDYVYPAEVWSTNSLQYMRQYSFVGKRPVKIEIDPEKRMVDVDRTNNIWSAPGFTP